MRIRVKDVKQEGIEVQGQLASEAIGERATDELRFLAPLRVEARVERVDLTLLVHVRMEGRYHCVCYRCLEDVEATWRREFDLDFALQRHTEFVELDEDLRQEVILSLPMRVLCAPQCRGLCPRCGSNRNRDRCSHDIDE